MKSTNKGFTLLELMIVVAIIGLLVAIAVPNFLRYQLRSKAAELRTNVEAIRKSQESLRQAERQVCANAATGQYVAFGRIPLAATGTPGAVKLFWLPADYAAAGTIDWSVEGGTYAVYSAATAGPPAVIAPTLATCAAAAPLGALGRAITVAGDADIDGDGVLSAVAYWKPVRTNAGVLAIVAPAAPTIAGANLTNCAGGLQVAANVGDGQIHSCSAENVF